MLQAESGGNGDRSGEIASQGAYLVMSASFEVRLNNATTGVP